MTFQGWPCERQRGKTADKIGINVGCLDGVDLSTIEVKEFDGKNWEHAMADRGPWW